jgi:hypothetical protein
MLLATLLYAPVLKLPSALHIIQEMTLVANVLLMTGIFLKKAL